MNSSNQGLTSSNSNYSCLSVIVLSIFMHGGGESSHCPSPKSWELFFRLKPSHTHRTASGQTCQHSFSPSVSVSWQRDESWELSDLPFWELLQGRMLGMSKPGERRLGIPLPFSFSPFKKDMHLLCLCQHKPLLSRAGSSSSASSSVCKCASETCCLLEFCVLVLPTPMAWVSQQHSSSFFSLCLPWIMQMCHEAPLCQGQHSAWTKQGGARVFTAGQRWEGWLAKGKRRGGKNLCSLNFWLFCCRCGDGGCWCLSSNSSKQGLFYALCLCTAWNCSHA